MSKTTIDTTITYKSLMCSKSKHDLADLVLQYADANQALHDRLAKQEPQEGAKDVLVGALEEIKDGPTPLSGYLQGIRCGIEDRCIQGDSYESAEYGYQQGLDYCADIANRALEEYRGSGG